MRSILQLWQLYISENNTQKYSHAASAGLFCLFVGKEMRTVDRNTETFLNLLAKVWKHINDSMSGTAENRFPKWYKNSSKTLNSVAVKVLRQLHKNHNFSNEHTIFFWKVWTTQVLCAYSAGTHYKPVTWHFYREDLMQQQKMHMNSCSKEILFGYFWKTALNVSNFFLSTI